MVMDQVAGPFAFSYDVDGSAPTIKGSSIASATDSASCASSSSGSLLGSLTKHKKMNAKATASALRTKIVFGYVATVRI